MRSREAAKHRILALAAALALAATYHHPALDI